MPLVEKLVSVGLGCATSVYTVPESGQSLIVIVLPVKIHPLISVILECTQPMEGNVV